MKSHFTYLWKRRVHTQAADNQSARQTAGARHASQTSGAKGRHLLALLATAAKPFRVARLPSTQATARLQKFQVRIVWCAARHLHLVAAVDNNCRRLGRAGLRCCLTRRDASICYARFDRLQFTSLLVCQQASFICGRCVGFTYLILDHDAGRDQEQRVIIAESDQGRELMERAGGATLEVNMGQLASNAASTEFTNVAVLSSTANQPKNTCRRSCATRAPTPRGRASSASRSHLSQARRML